MKTINDVPLLIRREIEARLAGPLVEAMAEELGREKALAILTRTIDRLAGQAGRDLAGLMGGDTLEHFAQSLAFWQVGGALDLEEKKRTENELEFDITRCAYVDMYRRLGLGDLGTAMSCRRDFALLAKFNPELKLERTRTLMEGADRCDFRITRSSAKPDEK